MPMPLRGFLRKPSLAPQPCAKRPRRRSTYPRFGRKVVVDARLGRDLCAVANFEMFRKAGLASDTDEIAQFRRAGNARLGNDQAMPANAHVMADLDKIADLRALADDGVARCAPIDRVIAADLDIVLQD